jgi:asparagine synthase (glutamine-hydrolysing)
MADRHPLCADYVGSCGRVSISASGEDVDHLVTPFVPFPDRTWPSRPRFVWQWTRQGAVVPDGRPRRQERLLFGGTVAEPPSDELVTRLTTWLHEGHYHRLSELRGEHTGALVTRRAVYLFRSLFTQNTLFYRTSGDTVTWSTDPSDLVGDGLAELDRATIWRLCRGDNVAAYPRLRRLRAGHVMVFDGRSTTDFRYDEVAPEGLPRGSSLQDYADHACELLWRATRPYADSGRIGVMLSGGLDSAAVTTALVDTGADVTAYHVTAGDPLADESAYARAVCRHLDVPIVAIPGDTGNDYLSRRWTFPQPYNHYAYRWQEQIADRVQQDGITFLATGNDGNLLFDPVHDYGLRDFLSSRLRWAEKRQLLRGALCARWSLPDLVRSISRSRSLLTAGLPVGDNADPIDFLVPMPGVPDDIDERMNFEFTSIEHTADLTLFWPRGIQRCSPMADRELYSLTEGMPNAYRWFPYGGRVIDKPVLRLMLSTRLPALVWRRYGGLWPHAPLQTFCLTHTELLAELIGSPASLLVRMNIVDPDRLAVVLEHPPALRRNTNSLIWSAMTELFLRGLDNRAPTQRGAEHHAATPTRS